jgi:hypothetical protein
MYARGFQHSTHTTARDHTRAGSGGPEKDRAGSVRLGHIVRYGVADQGYANHVFAGVVSRLANCVGYLGCLACACTHGALPVAHYDNGAEVEAASTLHYLSYAVDLDQLLLELRYIAFYPWHFSSGAEH